MAVETVEEQLRRLAFLELNLLRYFDESHLQGIRGAEISSEKTILWDLNGQPLLHRYPLIRDGEGVGFVDIGVQRSSLALFQAASSSTWNSEALLARARTEASKLFPENSFFATRFVCYSFPKLAVQLLDADGSEVVMLSLGSWERVPQERPKEPGRLRSDFERWSFLEEFGHASAKHIEDKIQVLEAFASSLDDHLRSELFGSVGLSSRSLPPSVGFSGQPAKCQIYLIPQENNVWCVPASVEMTLGCFNLGRGFSQTDVAGALLQNGANPIDADPLSEPTRVPDAIDRLSTSSLEATVTPSPQFGDFQMQIDKVGPVLCQISGHMYVVKSYNVITSPAGTLSQTLLVYDPDPPLKGRIYTASFDATICVNNYNVRKRSFWRSKLRNIRAFLFDCSTNVRNAFCCNEQKRP
jgi:hypothetical protein